MLHKQFLVLSSSSYPMKDGRDLFYQRTYTRHFSIPDLYPASQSEVDVALTENLDPFSTLINHNFKRA